MQFAMTAGRLFLPITRLRANFGVGERYKRSGSPRSQVLPGSAWALIGLAGLCWGTDPWTCRPSEPAVETLSTRPNLGRPSHRRSPFDQHMKSIGVDPVQVCSSPLGHRDDYPLDRLRVSPARLQPEIAL